MSKHSISYSTVNNQSYTDQLKATQSEVKAHYFAKEVATFENYLKTKVVSVERYSNDSNTLHIDIRLNPTNDQYISLSDRIDVLVTFNLTNNTYTIKATGKGARKYNYEIKRDIEMIMNHTFYNAATYYIGDIAEALDQTTDYYCNQLKAVVTDKAEQTKISNELYFEIRHNLLTVSEIEVLFNSIISNLTDNKKTNNNEQTPETFHLYNNTFNSYNEAYNYALNNSITVTMILSSLHPTMTNERLQQLEKEYVFSKHNMSIDDMKEYYDYISALPETMDKQDRYYRLKSLIQRYESKQQRIKQRKEEEYALALQDKHTLEYMLSNGLTIESTESGMQKYILDNQTIHVWASGGLSANEYHEMIMKMYNNHFNLVTS